MQFTSYEKRTLASEIILFFLFQISSREAKEEFIADNLGWAITENVRNAIQDQFLKLKQ